MAKERTLSTQSLTTRLCFIFALCSALASAQSLAPRAYIITPIHTNAVTLVYSYQSGNLEFTGSTPITGATAQIHLATANLFHAFNFFGRSANFTAVLPYSIGNFQGTVKQVPAHVYRSGLLDSQYRFAVNLHGGPAMDAQQFAKWRQKTLIGVSFTLVAPTGQYDPTKLVNFGSNRWSFKPEIGVSQRWGRWVLDGYGAVWFFTTNNDYFSNNQFFPYTRNQTESPVGAFETHLSYDFKPYTHRRLHMWASLDGNVWFGGQTSISGVPTPRTTQRSSRLGGTLAVPYTDHQSIKLSYSDGAYVLYGGNYQTVQIGWQYSWLRHPN
jgi:hypothetical protein